MREYNSFVVSMNQANLSQFEAYVVRKYSKTFGAIIHDNPRQALGILQELISTGALALSRKDQVVVSNDMDGSASTRGMSAKAFSDAWPDVCGRPLEITLTLLPKKRTMRVFRSKEKAPNTMYSFVVPVPSS